jgi:hypothetical protein
MSRPRRDYRRREGYDTDEYDWRFEREPIRRRIGPGLLLALLIGGILLLWAVQSGYGILALVLLLAVGVLAGGAWIRVLRANGRRQRAERAQKLAQARMELAAQQAEIEAVQRHAHAEHLRAQAIYLKAEAEADRLAMRVEQDHAALDAGLHYPGTHGYPVYVAESGPGQPPLIKPTDYRALLPRKAGEPADVAQSGQAPALIGNLPLPGPLRDSDVLRGWDLRPVAR